MSKPRVLMKCPANVHTGKNERIIEFAFADGTGGLISFRTSDDGSNVVNVYCTDPSITVTAAHDEKTPSIVLRGKRKVDID